MRPKRGQRRSCRSPGSPNARSGRSERQYKNFTARKVRQDARQAPRGRRRTATSPPPSAPRIDDDGEISHRRLDQLLGSVARRGVEEQRIARLHHVAAVAVAIAYLAGQHVDELDAGMAEIG